MGLKTKSATALFWDLLGTFSRSGISFIISVFLARLLEPEEFGLVGMAMVIIAILQVFTDFGFASSLIQNKKNSSLTYSSVFYLNLVAGFIILGFLQLTAPLVGYFYDNSEVTAIIRWLSLTIIFSSLNIVQQTILMRNIDFKKLTIRAVTAQVIGGVVGIVMAFKGFGVYALVAQTLIGGLLNTLLLWKITDWYPKLEFSVLEIKKMAGYSTFIFLDQVSNSIFKRLDVLFVGKIFSATTLGFYSRAESLNALVTKYSSKSLTKVFFPVLSSVQDDEKLFNNIYLKIFSVIGFLSFLLSGLMIIWGEILIITLFGQKWQPSVLIFQILALKSFAYPLNAIIVNAFLSKGKSRQNMNIGFLRKALLLIPLPFGLYFGLNGFLYSLIIINYISVLLNIYFIQRHLNFTFLQHFWEIMQGLLPLIALIIVYFNFELVSDPVVNSLIYTILYLFFFLTVNFLSGNKGFKYIRHNYNLIKKKIYTRFSPTSVRK